MIYIKNLSHINYHGISIDILTVPQPRSSVGPRADVGVQERNAGRFNVVCTTCLPAFTINLYLKLNFYIHN